MHLRKIVTMAKAIFLIIPTVALFVSLNVDANLIKYTIIPERLWLYLYQCILAFHILAYMTLAQYPLKSKLIKNDTIG